jgi:hypothetical protein
VTTDGISTRDWDTVKDYAAKIANATAGEDTDCLARLTTELLTYLDCLEDKYGKRPSVLATRADYLDDSSARAKMLGEAFRLAKSVNDRRNITLIASSLAEMFLEERRDIAQGEIWVAELGASIGDLWDDDDHELFRRLQEKLDRLKGRGSCGAVG